MEGGYADRIFRKVLGGCSTEKLLIEREDTGEKSQSRPICDRGCYKVLFLKVLRVDTLLTGGFGLYH
jgi:hypothetical protein